MLSKELQTYLYKDLATNNIFFFLQYLIVQTATSDTVVLKNEIYLNYAPDIEIFTI